MVQVVEIAVERYWEQWWYGGTSRGDRSKSDTGNSGDMVVQTVELAVVILVVATTTAMVVVFSTI